MKNKIWIMKFVYFVVKLLGMQGRHVECALRHDEVQA